MPRRQYNRQRIGSRESGTEPLRPERRNHVWSSDFVFARTEDGQWLKWPPICDEFRWELAALEVERRLEANAVIRILNAAVVERGCTPHMHR